MTVTEAGARARLSSSNTSRNRTPLLTILKAFKIISSTTSLTSSGLYGVPRCESCSRLAVLTSDDNSAKSDFRHLRRMSLR